MGDYMTSEEFLEEEIKTLARIVHEDHIIHVTPDDHQHETYYRCRHCGIGKHPVNRKCRNAKYFRHKLDCPVLIAKDFLRGEL